MLAAAGWRGLFLVGAALPLLALLASLVGLPESPAILAPRSATAASAASGGTLLALLRLPYRERTLRLWLVYGLSAMLLYFLISWLPIFLTAAGWSRAQAPHGIALLQVGGIVGSLVQAWLVDRRHAITALVGAYGMTADHRAAVCRSRHCSRPGRCCWCFMGSGIGGVIMSIIALGAIFYPPAHPGDGIWLGGGGEQDRRGARTPCGGLDHRCRYRAAVDAGPDRGAGTAVHRRNAGHAPLDGRYNPGARSPGLSFRRFYETHDGHPQRCTRLGLDGHGPGPGAPGGGADQAALLQSKNPKLAANKKLVFDMWRAIIQGAHTELAPKYFTKDYIQHNPNVATGRDAMVQYMKSTRPVKPIDPTITFPVVAIMAEGDKVLVATVTYTRRSRPSPAEVCRHAL